MIFTSKRISVYCSYSRTYPGLGIAARQSQGAIEQHERMRVYAETPYDGKQSSVLNHKVFCV